MTRHDLGWLTAQPFAHRGLHAAAAGLVENTPSAFSAAVARGFGIECDIHLSADGEAFVHHDDRLGRLNDGTGAVSAMTMAALKKVPFRDTQDRIPTLSEVLEIVGGRVPILIEVKSHFALRHGPLVERALACLDGYRGPAAIMSFDPEVVASLKGMAPAMPRGIVADDYRDPAEWGRLSITTRFGLRHLLHLPRTRPHFIAYWIDALPAVATAVSRRLLGKPLLTWTVRNAEQLRRARRHADGMIFEGIDPA